MTCRSAAIAASYGDRRGAVGCETQALRRQPTDPRLKTIATYTSGTLTGDVLAGISVAIVIIPQSLAYAQIAGLPPHIGLFAAALPLVVASFFVSSPYLQTGPVALTSLLTLGALKSLEPEGTAEYIQLAAMLAIVVGGTRLLLGLARMGGIAYLMSEPVVLGFTSGAAILIVSSQVPTIFDVSPPDGTALGMAAWTLAHPTQWSVIAVVFAVATVALIIGGRKISGLFPSVLIAVIGAMVYKALIGYKGTLVEGLPGGFIKLSLNLPWERVDSLIVSGIIIAIVGFAEPASIARTFATLDRIPWSASRELVSSGVANLVSGVSGGYPVGGSFSRTSLNRLAGAKTRVAGGVTGVVVLATLPIAPILENLPTAVLGAIVFAAVIGLIRIVPLLVMWRESRVQAVVASGTLVATLVSAPHVERGVVIGVILAGIAHLYRESVVRGDSSIDGSTLTIRPRGVLWFASTPTFERLVTRAINDATDGDSPVTDIDIDVSALGRLDYSGAAVLRNMIDDAEIKGMTVTVINIADHALRPLAIHLGGRCGVPDLDSLPSSVRRQRSWPRARDDCD